MNLLTRRASLMGGPDLIEIKVFEDISLNLEEIPYDFGKMELKVFNDIDLKLEEMPYESAINKIKTFDDVVLTLQEVI